LGCDGEGDLVAACGVGADDFPVPVAYCGKCDAIATGDQAGSSSSVSALVMLTWLVPSAFIVKISN
jgi:hypothetical protein